MMKLSRSGITTLKRMYKSVLLKCLLINAGIMLAAGNAMAADTWAGAITETTQFMDGLATQGWDRNDGNVTGWGVDQILGKMEDAAKKTDDAVSLVNDNTKGNEALDTRVTALEGRNEFTNAEKEKLAGLSNYDDTALAGRVTSLETTMGTKADASALDNYYTKEEANDRFATKEDALSKTDAQGTYLSKVDAQSTYLSKTDAQSTYATKEDYLSKADASTTYLSKADAQSTYATNASVSETYLSKADASTTYLSKADAATTYLTQAGATETYLSKADAATTYTSQTDFVDYKNTNDVAVGKNTDAIALLNNNVDTAGSVLNSIREHAADATYSDGVTIRDAIDSKAGLEDDNKFTGENRFGSDAANVTLSEAGIVVKKGTDETFSVNPDGDVSMSGDLSVTGDVSAANGTFTVTEDDGIAYNDVFSVDDEGNTSVAGTFTVQDDALVVDEDGNVSMSGDLSVTGDVSAANVNASEGLNVGEDGAYLKVDSEGTSVGGNLSVTGDTTMTGNLNVQDGALAVEDGNVSMSGDLAVTGDLSAANGTFTVTEEDGLALGENFSVTQSGDATMNSLAFVGNPENTVNSIDVGEEGILGGEGEATTMATAATVAKTVGSIAGMENLAITDKSDVASAIDSLAESVEGALGGAFEDGGTWNSGELSAENGASYGTLTATTVTGALESLNSTIGTATTSGINGVNAGATINENIDAVNNIIGDVSKLNTENRNLTNGGDTAPRTVVEALNNIDATLGTIHGLAEKRGADYKGNLAEGTTVEMHLSALDDAIGDRSTITNENGSNGYKFSSDTMYVADVLSDVASQIGTAEDLGTAMNGVSADNTVNSNIASLNESLGDLSTLKQTHYASDATNVADAIKGVDTGLNRLDHDVRSLRSHFEAGMASAAALSALVPNARAHGNTQLSLGTGAYRGHNAVALGGFHWVNDNVLLNAGVAWDNNEATYRVGVTYSW